MTVANPAQASKPDDASVARVAVPVPLGGLFDYAIPGQYRGACRPGMRVEIPFGNRRLTGVIIETASKSSLAPGRLRPIGRLLDERPCLDPALLKLLEWCAAYYHHAPGEVVQTSLSARLRQGKPLLPAAELAWQAEAGEADAAREKLARAPAQARLFELLRDSGILTADALNRQLSNWRPAMKALVQKGLVRQVELTAPGFNNDPVAGPDPGSQQREVIDALLADRRHAVHLLHGVTGSGKTEVYIRLAQASIDAGNQVLLLVPEISLTPQLTARFQQRLANRVGIMHSALGDNERHRVWLDMASGECRMLIGTRSAVFTPMPEPGLIIIDEEHDNSLKQQDGFRYHARDVALVRARDAGIPVIMGSATPSLESLHNARQGRYRYHLLTERIASAHPTTTSLIDMRRQPVEDGISAELHNDIGAHLAKGNQVMLFINRRGYAPLLLCHQCGWTTQCRRCDANMTFHRHNNRLRCHHCGSETVAPSACTDCGSDELLAMGSGTERIEQALEARYEGARICRIDRDTTRARGALEQKLESIHSGEAQILVGTQMLAKGHDFPDVTLVGILDADQALHSADFRAPEHLAQLIIQVAGRAGRASKPGVVKIQTHHPDHPLLQILLHDGYDAFSSAALEEREQAGLPPFTHMVLIRSEAHRGEDAREFMSRAREVLDRHATPDVSLFGPVTAPMEKRAGRYRMQIIIQSGQRKPLHRCLRDSLPEINELPSARKARWSVDVDPVDTF